MLRLNHSIPFHETPFLTGHLLGGDGCLRIQEATERTVRLRVQVTTHTYRLPLPSSLGSPRQRESRGRGKEWGGKEREEGKQRG